MFTVPTCQPSALLFSFSISRPVNVVPSSYLLKQHPIMRDECPALRPVQMTSTEKWLEELNVCGGALTQVLICLFSILFNVTAQLFRGEYWVCDSTAFTSLQKTVKRMFFFKSWQPDPQQPAPTFYIFYPSVMQLKLLNFLYPHWGVTTWSTLRVCVLLPSLNFRYGFSIVYQTQGFVCKKLIRRSVN